MSKLQIDLTIVLIAFLGLLGWVLNIMAIINTEDILTGMGLARVVGIFLAPLGGVLGYL